MRASAGRRRRRSRASGAADRRADELLLRRRDGAARRCARRRCCAALARLRRLRRVQLRAAARSEARRRRGEARDETAAAARRAADRRQAAADDRPQRRRHAHARRTCRRSRGRASSLPRSTFTDPNGEMQTASTRIDALAERASSLGVKDRQLGEQPAAAPSSGRRARHRTASRSGASASRCAAVVSRSITHQRKRLVGGFYAYDNRTEVKDLGSVCSGNERRARPAAVRGDARRRRPGRADRAGRATRRATPPRRPRACGSRGRASSGSRRTTTTASTCCPRRSATSRARRRACRCACRSARRPRWSRSSAKA